MPGVEMGKRVAWKRPTVAECSKKTHNMLTVTKYFIMKFKNFLQHQLIFDVVATYMIPLEEAGWPEEDAQEILRSPAFTELLKKLKIEGPIQPVGEGGVGRAYSLGNRYVAKFTPDVKEAEAAAIIQKNPSESAAKVYFVSKVKELQRDWPTARPKNLYVIIMDRLNTGVGKRYRLAGNFVYNYMDDNPGPLTNLNQAYAEILRKMSNKYRSDASLLQAIKSVLNSVQNLYQQSAVLTQDTHGGNMAFNKRTPAFFDFGRSQLNLDSPKLAGVRIPSQI